jgi:hypothetical protein
MPCVLPAATEAPPVVYAPANCTSACASNIVRSARALLMGEIVAVASSNESSFGTGSSSRYRPLKPGTACECRAASRATPAVRAISSGSKTVVVATPCAPFTITRSVSHALSSDMFWCSCELAKRLMF